MAKTYRILIQNIEDASLQCLLTTEFCCALTANITLHALRQDQLKASLLSEEEPGENFLLLYLFELVSSEDGFSWTRFTMELTPTAKPETVQSSDIVQHLAYNYATNEFVECTKEVKVVGISSHGNVDTIYEGTRRVLLRNVIQKMYTVTEAETYYLTDERYLIEEHELVTQA